MESMALNQGLM